MTWKKTQIAKTPVLNLEIPDDLRPRQREVVAREIIDFIAKRSEKGLNVKGEKWSGNRGVYSDSYAKSLDFKIAGKRKNKVDLTLSSEMLNDIELIKSSKGNLKIGFSRSNNSRKKAEGNILGTYGKESPIRGKSRPFLGISKEDLIKIVSPYLD